MMSSNSTRLTAPLSFSPPSPSSPSASSTGGNKLGSSQAVFASFSLPVKASACCRLLPRRLAPGSAAAVAVAAAGRGDSALSSESKSSSQG
eukprot:CAMPEP_0115676866 /NCGR_PEP_ID=MMETSP0272-20121206/54918_1 /TAXON_ID=71861 /ORGANISM="Scrippsiella trochoidea, Strain CCMP3099" /LENGTH=90 /DNA_ID=CAMNT_0003115941 /DNA_START=247 /DNA_END=516 /DNA_ORIENTATION=-